MGGRPQRAVLQLCGLLHYNDSIFGTGVTVTAVAIRCEDRNSERLIKEKRLSCGLAMVPILRYRF